MATKCNMELRMKTLKTFVNSMLGKTGNFNKSWTFGNNI